MGMDIHMHIVKDGEVIKEDIFEGRNTEWFRNLQHDGSDWEYKYLPKEWGISPQAPDNYAKEYKTEDGYFGFYYINVKEYHTWFVEFRPDLQAGWVNTYDKWRIENKNYVPDDYYIPTDLSEIDEEQRKDMHFVEYKKEYDCSRWLFEYINENNIPFDADITYWFDC